MTTTQAEMFAGRTSRVTSSGVGFYASTTWEYRRAHMDDFVLRAACPNMLYVPRILFKLTDEGGDMLAWVLRSEKGADGEWHHYHVYGPDGKPKTEKRTYGHSPAQRYEPEFETFPSHKYPSECDDYFVTGDDGMHWKVGSRGNAHDILRAEIACNPRFWPDEKTELLRWMDEGCPDPTAGRKRRSSFGHGWTSEEPRMDLFRTIDRHFSERIRGECGPPVTEAEILGAHLPERLTENLIYNLHHYEK